MSEELYRKVEELCRKLDSCDFEELLRYLRDEAELRSRVIDTYFKVKEVVSGLTPVDLFKLVLLYYFR